MKKNRILSLPIAITLSVMAQWVMAATPDAGSLQQEILRNRETPPTGNPNKNTSPKLPEAPLTGKSFLLKELVFEGNTLLSNELLTRALSPCLNQELDFERLKSCAALVTETYQAAGWIAKAILPEQDIRDGRVSIKVIEAKFGSYVFTGQDASRVSKEQLKRVLDAHQQSGDMLNMKNVDRALLLADDIPGVGVTGNLDQGAQDGLTNVIIQLADEPLFSGNASVDNHGSISSGSNRFNASLNANSPLRLGDLLTLNSMISAGNRYARAEQTFPLGSRGLRFGVNASYLNYKLTEAQYAGMDITGSAKTVGVSTSFPIVRSRQQNLNITFNSDKKFYLNLAGANSVSDYEIKTNSIGLDGNLFDDWMGGGANYGAVTWTTGFKDLSGSSNQQSDALTANTQGHFSKVRYSFSRQQKINEAWSSFFNLSGQHTQRNLDSSESFFLGGSTGVRAYPTNEGRGSQGQLLMLELRARLPQGFSWVGFYDWGRVVGYPHNNFNGASEPNTFTLKGYGMSVTWQTSKGTTLKSTLARRVGINPNPTSNGADQDGTLVKNRLWLSASLPF
jgi:hemolysin activation/secretion protein